MGGEWRDREATRGPHNRVRVPEDRVRVPEDRVRVPEGQVRVPLPSPSLRSLRSLRRASHLVGAPGRRTVTRTRTRVWTVRSTLATANDTSRYPRLDFSKVVR